MNNVILVSDCPDDGRALDVLDGDATWSVRLRACDDAETAWRRLNDEAWSAAVIAPAMQAGAGLGLIERVRGEAGLRDLPIVALVDASQREHPMPAWQPAPPTSSFDPSGRSSAEPESPRP